MLLGAGSARQAPITLSVSPSVAFAPTTFQFQLHITPHEDNRTVCLEYDGGEYSRSCWDINVDSPSRTQIRRLIGRGGEYVATATLYRVRDNGRQSQTIARTTFRALDPIDAIE